MNREPALIVGAIVGILAVIGVTVTADQSDTIIGGIVAIAAVIQAVVTRSQVTPTHGQVDATTVTWDD